MMVEAPCKYCGEDDGELSRLMTHVADLPASKVYLWKDDTYPGRCIVAFKRHKRELFELSADELARYMGDVARVAKAVTKVSECRKVNYAIYGDTAGHLHFHVVPKSPRQPNWGEAFVLMPASMREADPGQAARLLESLRVELDAS
jgi:diadenosine tetraphosphate (Ap4A) HIT family hydrolase